MKLKEWGAFWLLALAWGSSFLWIKIALEEIGPFTLIALRLLFGSLGLLAVMGLQRQPFPRHPKLIPAYLFMGAFNTGLPFVLIAWGETRIDSGLASILNGTMPLFTIIIAHFWLHDEKITLPRLLGLLLGFMGVVVLVSRDFGPQGIHSNLWGQLACLAAAVSYATGINFSRKHLRGQPPVVQATMVVLNATVLVWLATPFLEHPLHLPTLPITWLAVAWLGLLGSCLAYLLYFYLLNAWGATRASLVIYVLPIVGLLLGITFLDEVPDWRLVAGSLLVVAGIAVVNLRPQLKPKPAAVAAAD
ncbi:MAG: DMT family transporter [Deinococcus sp.]|nr:DMT family transporter [Deinococcus sp.]